MSYDASDHEDAFPGLPGPAGMLNPRAGVVGPLARDAAPGTGPAVTPMLPEHLGEAASLHLAALPHGFFAELGARFLRSYHATYVDSPHAVALAAVRAGRLLGFVVGPTHPPAHRAWVLRRRGRRLAAAGAAALLLRPRVALRFARTRVGRYVAGWRRGRAQVDAATAQPAGVPAVLSHIAVHEEARGTGVGRELAAAFVREAGRAGADRVVLATLDDARGAADFYAKEGWEDEGVRTGPDDVRMRFFAHPTPRVEQ